MQILFDGDLTDNDLLALANHVGGLMMENDMLAQQAWANTKEQFGASLDYKNVMMDSVADGLDKYQEMAKQVLSSPRVQDGLSEICWNWSLQDLRRGGTKRKPICAIKALI